MAEPDYGLDFFEILLIENESVTPSPASPSRSVLYKKVFKTLCSNLFVHRSEADDCYFVCFKSGLN